MSKRTPSIPSIPAGIDPKLRPFFNAVREGMQVLGNQGRGNILDAAITRRDIQNGILSNVSTSATSSSVGSGDGSGTGSVDVPVVPVNLSVSDDIRGVRVTWDRPTYDGHKHTNVYTVFHALGSNEHLSPVLFAQASLYTSSSGNTAFVQAQESQYVSIFVAHENANGVVSDPAGPSYGLALIGTVLSPTAPTGVQGGATFDGIYLTWDEPTYAGHSKSKIYCDFVDADSEGDPLRAADLSNRTYMWEGEATGARIPLREGRGGHWFVTHENLNGAESPVHDTGGLALYAEIYAEPPSVPSSVSLTPVSGGLIVKWAGTTFEGYSHSNIYVQSDLPVDGEAGSPPNFNPSSQLSQTAVGRVAFVALPDEVGAYVWVSHENILGEESAVHAVVGAYGIALTEPGTLIDRISDGIDETFFTSSLQNLLQAAEDFDFSQSTSNIGLALSRGQDALDDALEAYNKCLEVEGSLEVVTDSLETQFGVGYATWTQQKALLSMTSESVSTIEENLITQFGTNFSEWSAKKLLISNAEGSLATIKAQLRVSAGDNTVEFEDFASVIAEAENNQYVAQWGTKLNVNGTSRGVGFIATNSGGTDDTLFYMNADSVIIGDPTDNSSAYPFVVTGGTTYINDAIIRTAYIESIVTGTVTTEELTVSGWTLIGGGLSTPRINTLATGAWDTSYNFSVNSTGNMRARNADFSGNISASTITGGTFRTSSGTGSRTIMSGETGYSLWAGTGAQTDDNAVFYLKTNGEAAYNGLLNVRQLEGDVYDALSVSLTSDRTLTLNQDVNVLTCVLNANPHFDRTFAAQLSLSFGTNRAVADNYDIYIMVNSTQAKLINTVSQDRQNTTTQISATIPASASNSTVELRVKARSKDIAILMQEVPLAVYRTGAQFVSISVDGASGGGGGGSPDPSPEPITTPPVASNVSRSRSVYGPSDVTFPLDYTDPDNIIEYELTSLSTNKTSGSGSASFTNFKIESSGDLQGFFNGWVEPLYGGSEYVMTANYRVRNSYGWSNQASITITFDINDIGDL